MRQWVGLVVGVVLLGSATGHAAPQVSAPGSGPVAYLVADAITGTVIAEKDADKQWPPASMAKMMTVLVALEKVRDGAMKLDDPVSVSAKAAATGGSQVYLAQGETFTLGQMLEAVMISSANDASVAVAEHIAGSTPAFVELMNARAKALGLTGTTYQSVHGLPPDPGQQADLTTARDLMTLGRELMRHPDAAKWGGTSEATFRNGSFVMRNTNHLVRTYDGATGLKTGYYAKAGFSVTATAKRGDLSLVAVVLGVPNKQGSFTEAARLMSDGFANYRMVVAARRGVPVGTVPVSGGAQEGVKAMPIDDLRVLVKRSDDKQIAVEARIPRLVSAPVQRRQPLGNVVVRRGDQEIASVPVIADGVVPGVGWLSWLWNRGLPPPAAPADAKTP
jgi:serine-type D-Ala-D-Ala carboxypeptidase (penicillin-binding protein 5/6)